MKQICKFIISILFAGILTIAVSAASGSSGANAIWKFDVETNILTISVTGEMSEDGNTDLSGKRYVQSSLQIFGYDYIPDEGFAFSDPTTSTPPYVEFTDSGNGTVYLWNTYSDYFVDFTYKVDDTTITLCAANNDTFGGTDKIVMEYDPHNDLLEVIDLNMPSDRAMGWTVCNDIFTFNSSVTAAEKEEREQVEAESEQQSEDIADNDTSIWSAAVTFNNTPETYTETIIVPEDFDVTFETIESMPEYKGIRTPEQLNAVRYDLSGMYILLNDIDMAEWGNWEPIGNRTLPFTGIFDGNGYTISFLKINIEEEYQNDADIVLAGLFGVVDNSELRNIVLSSCEYCIRANHIVIGGIAALVRGESLIYNCSFNGSIKSNCLDISVTVGGISGDLFDSSYVEYCGTSGTIENNGGLSPDIGGIAGKVSGHQTTSEDVKSYIRYSNSECDIISHSTINSSYIGGIAGDVSIGKISDCYFSGAISVSDDAYAGGIVGMLNGAVKNCYSIGSIISVDRYDEDAVENSEYNYPSWFRLYSGFIGFRINSFAQDKTIENCFVLRGLYTDIIGRDELNTDSNAIRELADNDMKLTTSFENWDFDSVWMIDSSVNNGYPAIRQSELEQILVRQPLDNVKIGSIFLIILGTGLIIFSVVQIVLNSVKNKTECTGKSDLQNEKHIECKVCGHLNEHKAEFCGNCGTRLHGSNQSQKPADKCPECGAAIEEGMTFCGNCGKRIR